MVNTIGERPQFTVSKQQHNRGQPTVYGVEAVVYPRLLVSPRAATPTSRVYAVLRRDATPRNASQPDSMSASDPGTGTAVTVADPVWLMV